MNCLFSFIFWKEKLSPKVIVGTITLIAGVIVVALAKGRVLTNDEEVSEDERSVYKFMSIGCALFGGFLGATRVQQAKLVSIKYKYNPMEFSNDGALLCGVIIMIISGCYYFSGHPGYTWYNLSISFIASIF